MMIRTIPARTLLLAVIFISRSVAQTVGLTTASTSLVSVATPTLVTVTSVINSPGLIPQSVLLQRLNTDGSVASLGAPHDDGLNGDATLGDSVFTLRITLNEPAPVDVQLRVSAAFRGVLRRINSEVMTVHVRTPSTPQQMFNLLSAELSSGDISAALKHFPGSAADKEVLNGLTAQQRTALATAFATAQLVQNANGGRSAVYQISWKDDSGNPITLKIIVSRSTDGVWNIVSW